MPTPNLTKSPRTSLRRWAGLILFSSSIAVLSVFGFWLVGGGALHAAHNHPTTVVVQPDRQGWIPIESFFQFVTADPAGRNRFFAALNADWRSGYAPMLLEVARFYPSLRTPVVNLLKQHVTGGVTRERDALWQAIWRTPYEPHPRYAEFKSQLYRQVDPRFADYFANDRATTIRLDEARWGGVVRDGIPPLKNPEMLPAGDARYLADSDLVFGIEINGDARAYPKRILAWHEMFKDTIGGVSICGVYCTLCGMVIPYETEFDGVHHELGTSGFLYRSNKMMYDHATESMWSTTNGTPIVGPLVGKGIKLKTRPVVSTTWGEWRRRHPGTTVLSLNTGHSRDYGEGVAYREYFATDRLMFTVPKPAEIGRATPIANKAEVLALRFGKSDAGPLAIRADFLSANPLYQNTHGGQPYVVLTDATGANRVYASAGHRFTQSPGVAEALSDETGTRWVVSENELTAPNGATLPRLSAHRAFWFGWRAANPSTKLIEG